jgi:hypothetical protein
MPLRFRVPDLLAFGALLLCPGGDFLPDPDDFVASLLGEGTGSVGG